MANEIVARPPAHLQKYQPTAKDLGEYVVPGGVPMGVISLDGKKFAVKYKGEVFPAQDAQGYPKPYIDIVVLMANPLITKTFYLKGWEQGAPTTRPDCYSLDGEKPEPDSPHLQHPTCGGCPKNAWEIGRAHV